MHYTGGVPSEPVSYTRIYPLKIVKPEGKFGFRNLDWNFDFGSVIHHIWDPHVGISILDFAKIQRVGICTFFEIHASSGLRIYEFLNAKKETLCQIFPSCF